LRRGFQRPPKKFYFFINCGSWGFQFRHGISPSIDVRRESRSKRILASERTRSPTKLTGLAFKREATAEQQPSAALWLAHQPTASERQTNTIKPKKSVMNPGVAASRHRPQNQPLKPIPGRAVPPEFIAGGLLAVWPGPAA